MNKNFLNSKSCIKAIVIALVCGSMNANLLAFNVHPNMQETGEQIRDLTQQISQQKEENDRRYISQKIGNRNININSFIERCSLPIGNIGNDVLRDLCCKFERDDEHRAFMGIDYQYHVNKTYCLSVCSNDNFDGQIISGFELIRTYAAQLNSYIKVAQRICMGSQTDDYKTIYLKSLIGESGHDGKVFSSSYFGLFETLSSIKFITGEINNNCLDVAGSLFALWNQIPVENRDKLVEFGKDLKRDSIVATSISYAVAFMRTDNQNRWFNFTKRYYDFKIHNTRGELFDFILNDDRLVNDLTKRLTFSRESIVSALNTYSSSNISSKLNTIFDDGSVGNFIGKAIVAPGVIGLAHNPNMEYSHRAINPENETLKRYGEKALECPFFIPPQ